MSSRCWLFSEGVLITSSLLHPSPARWPGDGDGDGCDSLLTMHSQMDGGWSQFKVLSTRCCAPSMLRSCARALSALRALHARAPTLHRRMRDERRAGRRTLSAGHRRVQVRCRHRVSAAPLSRASTARSRDAPLAILSRASAERSLCCAPTLLLHMRYVRGICASSFSAVFPPCDRPSRSVPCTRSPAHTVCAHCSQLSSNGARSAVALRRRSLFVGGRPSLMIELGSSTRSNGPRLLRRQFVVYAGSSASLLLAVLNSMLGGNDRPYSARSVQSRATSHENACSDAVSDSAQRDVVVMSAGAAAVPCPRLKVQKVRG